MERWGGGGGEGGKKRGGGVKAVLDWQEGGGLFFFQQLIGGSSSLCFARGLFCAFANGITSQNKLISKIQVVRMDNPIRRILL